MKFTNFLTALAAVTITMLVGAFNAHAALVKKDFAYTLAGKPYEGYLVYDDAVKAPKPGVLVGHNWMGLTEETKSKADQVAQLGYVAFAVDIYGKGIRPKGPKEAGELAGMFKKDRTMLRARMQQGLQTLMAQPQVDKKRLAVIGYCFGGTAALELGRAGADVKAITTFHAGLDSPKPEDGKRIKAKVLVLHGADDPYNPATDVAAFENEMRNAKVDWQLVQYGGAVHSFTEKGAGNDNSKGAAYNANADRRSWQAMQDFFKETL
jgi:dienelactone hydrolase